MDVQWQQRSRQAGKESSTGPPQHPTDEEDEHDFAHRSGKRPKVRGELVHTKQLHEHRHGKVDPVAERPDVVRAPPVAVDDAIGRLVIDDFIGAEEAREKNGSQRDGDQEQAGAAPDP